MRKATALLITLILLASALSGCGANDTKAPVSTPAPEPVTLTVAGAWLDCKAIETVGAMFTEKNPGCSVVYENINDYYANLEKRMTGDDAVDIFFVGGLQGADEIGSEMLPYALDLKSASELDLSHTYAPLVENFLYREDTSKLFSIPLGAELRGMFVNLTLLKSVGIDKAPTDRAQLLEDCRILKQAGYIPMQGNPEYFAQWLITPWVFNCIANAPDPDEARAVVNARDGKGVVEIVREPFEFLYDLSKEYYYDYKTAQKSLDLFNDSTQEDHARYFFNIVKDGDAYKKKDDSAGQIAFMPAPISYTNTMDTVKEDYSSDIEYAFMPAPVAEKGGYVYLSPAHCIAINKGSSNLDLSIKFIDYLFTPEVNEVFAKEFNIMPNVEETFSYVSALYDVAQDQICHLGQATFTWGFYGAFKEVATQTAKSNKPDTIAENGGKMYELDHYLNMLEDAIDGDE